MPKFIIERTLPGAGALSQDQLQGVAATSCGVLREMGPSIQWVESFVTDDKIYCVYNAENEEAIREHARRGGFPADAVNLVRNRIDPTTSEAAPVA
jgi:Nickel responsive protein SCO4226-like